MSFDPNDDAISFLWSDSLGTSDSAVHSTLFGLGDHVVNLTVSDGSLAATDTVNVSVQDTIAPAATVSLERVSNTRGGSAEFIVGGACVDSYDGSPVISAEINGVTVQDGELVRLKLSNRSKVSIRKGVTTIQGNPIVLTVTCQDNSGNASTATVQPSFG